MPETDLNLIEAQQQLRFCYKDSKKETMVKREIDICVQGLRALGLGSENSEGKPGNLLKKAATERESQRERERQTDRERERDRERGREGDIKRGRGGRERERNSIYNVAHALGPTPCP